MREDENGKPLVFRDSLIENIRELVDVVPRLNIFADDDLAMLCREVKDKFAGIEPDALRPSGRFDPNLRRQVKRDADALTAQFAGYFAPAAGRAHPKQGGSLMATLARSESARRVSDCVTALLRDQPFFGSLALRLPIRADETRETLASDGKDIRYAPQWVADTDADHIKTALARVVLACALKHHTRRGGRDPERWQRASQLVTHGLLRDAGFVLPPEAEAWDGISAEQAYDRLPEPSDDGEDQSDACPSGNADDNGGAAGPQAGDGGDDQNAPSDPTDDGSPQEQDEPGCSGSPGSKPSGQCPASHDPCGTGEVMDADERRDDTGQSGESPSGHARRGAGVGRGHAPGRESRPGARQRAGRRRGDDPASAPEHPRLAVAVAPLHDRCRAPRL